MSTTDDLPDDLAQVANQLREVRHEPPLEQPDPALLARIHSSLGDELASPPSVSATPAARAHRASPRLRRRSLLLGGALGLGLGAAGAVVATQLSSRATVVAKAVLRGLSEAAPELGSAQLVQTRRGLELDIRTNEPINFADGFLEVWLLNSDGSGSLVSVGLFRPGDRDRFPIDQAVYQAGFSVVDISRQRYSEGLDHSGDSLMRGSLRPE